MSTDVNERVTRVQRLLLEALEIEDSQQRGAFLSEACGTDLALRQEIEELLNAEADAGRFLPDRPVATNTPLALLGTLGEPTANVPVVEKPGDHIDRYKLLEKIGEGGYGVVYLAEQRTPVRRKVALKVIKLGMDTRQVVARFEAERQALALMDHPNIAKVLDAGATETGRPFFVMELVRGVKITRYCDRHGVSTRQRLELFIQVCQAVQHAHQKGIIHRDLKPSNILVTVNDGVPVPKVIDFGIAKATQARLTDQTLFTAFAQFLGTPAYMSPEQAELTSVDVDTRSDIYSLGVLLYELLTGKTPFDTQPLMASGLDELRRTIRETEPARPSTRLTRLAEEELRAAAQHRGVEAPKLIHLVRGDLDWIVMRCLEKDRNRRYETANGLARDVRRHLNNEPVVARPPSRIYSFQKFVRRHRFTFLITGAGTASLVAGLVACAWLLLQERAARQLAVAAQHEAQSSARKSQHTIGLLRDALKPFVASVAEGQESSALLDFLDRTSQNVQTDLQNQPELAQFLQSTLALLYLDAGEGPKAEALARKALAAAQNRTKSDDVLSLEPLLAVLREVLFEEHKYAEVEGLFADFPLRETDPLTRKVPVLWMRGDSRARIGHWREAVADFSKLIELEPQNPDRYFCLAPLLVQTRELETYGQVCEQIRTRFATKVNDASFANRLAGACLLVPTSGANLAAASQMAQTAVILGRGRSNEAWCQLSKSLAEYRQGHQSEAVTWCLKVLAKEGERPRRDVEAYMILAMAQHKLGEVYQARTALAEGIAIAQREMPEVEGKDLTGGWVDWLTAHILMREAKALIEPGAKTNSGFSD